MIADAIKKIKDSMEGIKETRVPAEPIVKHLVGRLEGDEKLAALVVQSHKTLEKCFEFVYEQACKHLDKKNGWIDDNEVYLMAMDYFLADDAELERKKAVEKAEKDEKRKKEMEESRIRSEQFKAKQEAEKAQKAFMKKQAPGQMSLFGGDDEDGAEQEQAKAA